MSTVGSNYQGSIVTTGIGEYPPFWSVGNQVAWASEALGLIVIPAGWEFSRGYRLRSVLLVQLLTSEEGVLATTYLETEEYGWGNTGNEAITDLMSSLVEYIESLESRREKLSEKSMLDLTKLHQLIQANTTT